MNAPGTFENLDGTRDRPALARWLSADAPLLESSLKEVNNHLEELRRLGLLVDNM